MKNKLLSSAVLSLILALVIIGCLPGKSFKSVSYGYDASYNIRQPLLFILTSQSDTDKVIPHYLTQNQAGILKQIDYRNSFAVVIIYGPAGPDEPSFRVDHIQREGTQIILEAIRDKSRPVTDKMVALPFVSPFEILSLKKSEFTGSSLEFILRAELVSSDEKP